MYIHYINNTLPVPTSMTYWWTWNYYFSNNKDTFSHVIKIFYHAEKKTHKLNFNSLNKIINKKSLNIYKIYKKYVA